MATPFFRNTPGILGTRAFAAGSSVEFLYAPRSSHSKSTYFTNPSEDGTVQLLRRSSSGDEALAAAAAVTGGSEDLQEIDFPVTGTVVVRYTNTNATAGQVTAEAADDGE